MAFTLHTKRTGDVDGAANERPAKRIG